MAAEDSDGQYLSSSSNADLDDLVKRDANLDRSFPNVIILAGLPIVDREKYDKLISAISLRVRNRLVSVRLIGDAPLESPFHIDMPIVKKNKASSPNGKASSPNGNNASSETTLGFCFLVFKNSSVASKALPHLGTLRLNENRQFIVCPLDKFDEVVAGNDNLTSSGNFGFSREAQRDWLQDPMGREVFAYRHAQSVVVAAHDPIQRQPEILFPSPKEETGQLGKWMAWSPQGSYLITFHKKGIWLRGNENFDKLICFNHPSVKHIYVSPNEEYLVTWDGTHGAKNHEQSVKVWQVLTGTELRTFPAPRFATTGALVEEGAPWPFLLFSHDSRYLAMRCDTELVVYEVPGMNVLEEAAPKTGSTRSTSLLNFPLGMFSWSPAANVLALWAPEKQEAPSRLVLVEIPSRMEIATRNVFSVTSVNLDWHPRGDFLALRTVIARKKGKKTKTETVQIEVFKMREKSIPVDTISLEGVSVRSLVWEKGVGRFAVLVLDESSDTMCIRFYQAPTKRVQRDTELVASKEVRSSTNYFEWSPGGQYFVAASRPQNGAVLFGCLNEQNKVEVLHRDEYDLTDVMYDPSGRYVVVAGLMAPGAVDYRFVTGFRIYSFMGKLQYRLDKNKLEQVLWRPHPPSLLSAERIEDVQRKLKDYSKRYDALDDVRRQVKRQETSGRIAEVLQVLEAAKNGLKKHPLYSKWCECWEDFNRKMEWKETETTREQFAGRSHEAVVQS